MAKGDSYINDHVENNALTFHKEALVHCSISPHIIINIFTKDGEIQAMGSLKI